MATIEQATMPYALDALRKYASLRKLASPELTKEEINDAIARTTAVKTLLDAVKTAADGGTTADDFIKAQQGTITPSGLSDANVRTMFQGVELKKTIDEKHGHVGEGKGKDKKTGKSLAEEIPEADRLGLGTGSLSAYIKGSEEVGREPRRVAAAGGRQHARSGGRADQLRRHVERRHRAGGAGGARAGGRRAGQGSEAHRGGRWSRRSGPRTTPTRAATATTSSRRISACIRRPRRPRPNLRRSRTRARS